MTRVKKKTIYLTEELSVALKRAAAESGCTQAELIRAGIARVVEEHRVPRPGVPLFASGDPTLAERVDEILAEGFGED
jgi:hypothetical protein